MACSKKLRAWGARLRKAAGEGPSKMSPNAKVAASRRRQSSGAKFLLMFMLMKGMTCKQGDAAGQLQGRSRTPPSGDDAGRACSGGVTGKAKAC